MCIATILHQVQCDKDKGTRTLRDKDASVKDQMSTSVYTSLSASWEGPLTAKALFTMEMPRGQEEERVLPSRPLSPSLGKAE